MPNGYHGSKKGWERIEAPLRVLDSRLEDFARRHGMRLVGSERNWPSRSLHWGDTVERMIEISLENPKELTWCFWVCVWQDRAGRRYWKNSHLRQAVPIGEIDSSLAELLMSGQELADGWQAQDLEPAYKS
jgi:hypothetical protein